MSGSGNGLQLLYERRLTACCFAASALSGEPLHQAKTAHLTSFDELQTQKKFTTATVTELLQLEYQFSNNSLTVQNNLMDCSTQQACKIAQLNLHYITLHPAQPTTSNTTA